MTISGRTWTPAASVAPVHDFDGNLTYDGRWIYSWDAENRLTRMQTTTAAALAGVPRQRLDFVYDSEGRRVAKYVSTSTDGTNWTLASDLRFLYDGWNLIAEYEMLHFGEYTYFLKQATHVWGLDLSGTLQGAGGVGGLLCSTLEDYENSTTRSYFPAFDGNGNVSAWVSQSGALVGRMDYSPFGQLIAQYRFTQSGDNTLSRLPFGFSTKYTDRESRLLYYGYRYYDPLTGRWPSRDPIGEKGGVNLYSFVDNNGISYCDLLGLDTYILIYQNFGPMPFWKNSVKRSIVGRSESILYGTPFSCYKEGDKIVEIPVSSASDLEKIDNEKDVVYVGIFGHARWDVIFFHTITGPDVAIADTSTYKPDAPNTNMISTEAFTSRIHWKPCDSCCDDGRAIDLYACRTMSKDPHGDLPSIGEQIRRQVNGIPEGWDSVPGGDPIFVGGIDEGMSNWIPDVGGMLPACLVVPFPESRMPGVAPRNPNNRTCVDLNAFP